MEAGADVNIQGGIHGNPLAAASISPKPHVGKVQILLKAGANVDAQGGQFGSALCTAAYANNDRTVEVLLEAGADVNLCVGKCSPYGRPYRNAIQAAKVGYPREGVMQLLLNAGAVEPDELPL